MSWYRKLVPSRIKTLRSRSKVPEGVWDKCPGCDSIYYRPEVERNHNVCLQCGFHMPISARQRLNGFLDQTEREELGGDIRPKDVLNFRDSARYKDRLSKAAKATGERDALVALVGQLEQMPLVACAFEFNFIGGSMGAVVGQRFVIGAEYALNNQMPLVCFTTSGGARMQESLISLFQMSRVSAALAKLSEARLPFIPILCHPTMGGVSASLAMLGDIILAEPDALIGFAGPRVIRETVREDLPEGFQRSEFLLEHGAVDAIVARHEMREKVAHFLRMFMYHRQKRR